MAILHSRRTKIPVYGQNLTIAFTDNIHDCIESHGILGDYSQCAGVIVKQGVNFYLYFRKDADEATFVHLVNRLFSMIDYKSDPDNDEPQAYLTDTIFSLIKKEYGKLLQKNYKKDKIVGKTQNKITGNV